MTDWAEDRGPRPDDEVIKEVIRRLSRSGELHAQIRSAQREAMIRNHG